MRGHEGTHDAQQTQNKRNTQQKGLGIVNTDMDRSQLDTLGQHSGTFEDSTKEVNKASGR